MRGLNDPTNDPRGEIKTAAKHIMKKENEKRTNEVCVLHLTSNLHALNTVDIKVLRVINVCIR